MAARYVRPMRWSGMALAVLIATSCSGSEPVQRPGSDVVPTSVESTVTPSSTEGTSGPAVVEPREPAASVRIDVDVAGAEAELSGLLADSLDPFGQFVSCSGLRESFGTYSVLVSLPVSGVRSVSVVSADLVPGAGVHDASVRVEYASDPAVDASGTMTLADDLKSGTYRGSDADGDVVEGSFDCPGGATPEPLTIGADDAELDAVEVFALLRSGDAQRIVGLAVRVGGSAAVDCGGATDESDDTAPVIRVDGDAAIGAITSLELTGGASPTLRMRVGSTDYEFDRVDRGASDLPEAGTFGAESGGIAVDGAFRCS